MESTETDGTWWYRAIRLVATHMAHHTLYCATHIAR
jgi:hypothetical protein